MRYARRNARTRGHWTCASKVLYLINELQAYLQGEVIASSWQHLLAWLDGDRKGGLFSARSSRPSTASSIGQGRPPGTSSDPNRLNDPRTMAEAHRRYLHALNTALFLTDTKLITTLKELLDQLDHFAALFSRLQAVWEGLDLQEDEGVMDAFSNFRQDEEQLLAEMDRSKIVLETAVLAIVERIRDIEKEKRTGVTGTIIESMGELELNGSKFLPWQARTVDRLVMKLDGLIGRLDEDRNELVDDYDE